MADNYASLHKHELAAAVEAAPDHQTLDAIDEDLAREGWAVDGVIRSRIMQRHAEFDAAPV
jgi:hypothetical protein